MVNHEARFNRQDEVTIDGDDSIKAFVSAVMFRDKHVSYEVNWMHNGQSYCAWIEEWRLEAWDA